MSFLRKLPFWIFILLIFISLVRNLLNYQSKLKFYDDYQKEYEKEYKKNLSLKTEYLKKTDQYEIEKTIRNKLNLVKDNETSVILPAITPRPTVLTPTPLPNWQQWRKLFFSN